MRDIMRRMEDGRPIENGALGTDAATHVYILGLSPNAARLSVRFWMENSLGDFVRRFQEHWSDMRIEPAPRKGRSPAVWEMLYELAPLQG